VKTSASNRRGRVDCLADGKPTPVPACRAGATTASGAVKPTAGRSAVSTQRRPPAAGQLGARLAAAVRGDQVAAALAEGGTARRARIGWFVPVQCSCLFADEKTFQDTLEAIFKIAAPLDHMDVKVQPNTAMRLNKKTPKRIPDIYYFKLNRTRPSRGRGFVNELKVGGMGMDRRNVEADRDHALIKQGHGGGANTATQGRFLPVTAGLWWFAPNVNGFTYNNFTFIAHLLSLSINVIYIEQNQNSQLWPRRETKREKAKDVKEIESNDLAHASKALDSMIGPCLMVCPAP
jgi:hypothetical protein